MKRCRPNILPLLAIVLLPLLGSCRKDLCYDHDEHSVGYRSNVNTAWEQEWERPYGCQWQAEWNNDKYGVGYDALRPDAGKGIAALIYEATETKAEGVQEFHLPANGGLLYTTANTHSILFYNDDTEYIVFNDIASSTTASATTRTRTRASLSLSEPHSEERTVNMPDMLYGSFVPDFEPIPMAGGQQLAVVMRPLVFTYLVRYEIEQGAEYVALARGAMAGMAETVFLKEGRTGEELATLLFDCTLTHGLAEARILSFGVPGFPDSYYSRGPNHERNYALNLELMLKNGKKLDFEFDITDQMKNQPRGGVITVSGIRISDEEGAEGGSGFDASVDGWGEYEDIELDL